MSNTKEHFNQLDAIAVTELDNEAAAAIQGGAALTVYQDVGLANQLGEFNIGKGRLSASANDEISSIRITEGRWKFYEDANYKGAAIDFGPGNYDLTSYKFGFLGIRSWNDNISSFKRIG
ncbi:beta/gamma crystallin-related protein [Nostoc sp.]|uniref:beta/gamma crystallin-related protein n=1 Tax=Nostoc sp. TaxID=1180 RepID=UPI002FFA871E